MLYEVAHFVQAKVPCVWGLFEGVNSQLFTLRYGRRLKQAASILESSSGAYEVREARMEDLPELVRFFSAQPEETYTYFRPHLFDESTISGLIKRKSHLFFIVVDNARIVGYFFLRCFFIGKGYLGKLVDVEYRGKGIGKLMCVTAMDVALMLGIHMYETISKDNLESLYSTQNVLEVRILEEMENNYLYIEDIKRK